MLSFFGPTLIGPPPQWYRKSHANTQQVMAHAGPQSDESVWDSETEAGNLTVAPLTVDPSGVGLTFSSDGEPILGGVTSGRQEFDFSEYDLLTKAWVVVTGASDGITATYYINNEAPDEIATIPAQQAWTNIAYEGPILDDYVEDPEGDTLTWDFALGDTLPTGVSVQTVIENEGLPGERTVQQLKGTPQTGQDGTYDIIARGTDVAGATVTLTQFTLTVGIGVQVPAHTTSTPYTTLTDDLAAVGLQEDLSAEIDGGVTVGNVIESSPAAGTWVIPGSTVSVVVSGVAVPGIEGIAEAQATTDIEAAGLVSNPADGHSSTVPEGETFNQVPPEDTVVLPDSVVSFTVSLGPAQLGALPNSRYGHRRLRRYLGTRLQ